MTCYCHLCKSCEIGNKVTKVLRIAFICSTPRHPIQPQIAAVKAAGCTKIIALSAKGRQYQCVEYRSLVDALRTIRPGDELVIPYLYAFGFQRGSKRGYRREMFDDTIDEIDARGCKFRELSSGLWSGDPAGRRKMLRDARKAVKTGGRAIRSVENGAQNKRGRKQTDHATEVKTAAKLIWFNRRDYPTWDDVRTALRPIGVTVEYCYRTWKARTKRAK